MLATVTKMQLNDILVQIEIAWKGFQWLRIVDGYGFFWTINWCTHQYAFNMHQYGICYRPKSGGFMSIRSKHTVKYSIEYGFVCGSQWHKYPNRWNLRTKSKMCAYNIAQEYWRTSTNISTTIYTVHGKICSHKCRKRTDPEWVKCNMKFNYMPLSGRIYYNCN